MTTRPSTIAALPVGYADGLNRLLSNKGRVIVRDSYAPIVGRVSMDITLVDVTDIDRVSVADEVIIIGRSKQCLFITGTSLILPHSPLPIAE